MEYGEIIKISGPLVVAGNMGRANMFDVVSVGPMGLIGEIIEMRGEEASIQVYEETAGLKRGDQVVTTGQPLSVELGPGILEMIFDGIQRPLEAIRTRAGSSIARGVKVFSLDREKRWNFLPAVMAGDRVEQGDVLGTVEETELLIHKILVPPGVGGEITRIETGPHRITDPVAVLKDEAGEERKLTMLQKWPVRKQRPFRSKLSPEKPLITGQRVIDTFFPLVQGGAAAVPGPFGSGKTVVQHQLAKWSDVDLVVYVGCGERGNEMTEVLMEFPALKDPKSGKSLMSRTVLIANTSDMPVAAREASIYTGITIGEYFRDMGYSVAIMADSTSRWAEALREMSGRLEEMPGEEGYPAYLTSRLAQFYERAGQVICLGQDERKGTLTAIGAVSPAGGDLSDPVVQATLRIVKVFWGLDARLAYERHFPSINWRTSYSLYQDRVGDWMDRNIGRDWTGSVEEANGLLQQESELEEIVKLVGYDALSAADRLTLAAARSVREDFLQQNAFDPVDAYTSPEKQYGILRMILGFYHRSAEALEAEVSAGPLLQMEVWEKLARAKYVPEERFSSYEGDVERELEEAVEELRKEASA